MDLLNVKLNKIGRHKELLLFLVLSIFNFKAMSQDKREISKFIMQNYKVPTENIDYCKWNYLVLEISVNAANKINYKVLSQSDTALLKSVDFLKTYSVNRLERPSFPVLVVISIQDNVGMCDNQYAKMTTPSEVLQEIMPFISQSVKDYPKIRILDPIIANIEGTKE